MRNQLRAVAATMLLSISTHAQPPSVSAGVLKAAEIDFEYDAAKCAAFYSVVYSQSKRSGHSGPRLDIQRKAANTSMQLVVVVSRKIGMTDEALETQLKTDGTDIITAFGKDMVNAPAVLQKTGLPCKALLEHPEKRLDYWVHKEQSHKLRAAEPGIESDAKPRTG